MLLILPLFLACADEADENPSLDGEWELIEVCFSIGTGECTAKAPDYKETINFTDNSFEINRDGEICTGTQLFDGKASIDLSATTNTCNFDETTYRVSELTATTLILHPPCREGCSQTYKRI